MIATYMVHWWQPIVYAVTLLAQSDLCMYNNTNGCVPVVVVVAVVVVVHPYWPYNAYCVLVVCAPIEFADVSMPFVVQRRVVERLVVVAVEQEVPLVVLALVDHWLHKIIYKM
jgi:hypothetical protein